MIIFELFRLADKKKQYRFFVVRNLTFGIANRTKSIKENIENKVFGNVILSGSVGKKSDFDGKMHVFYNSSLEVSNGSN